MSLIAKCPPFPLVEGAERLLELPAYGAAQPSPGDTLYLWFAETAGGEGLAGRAQIAAVRAGKPLVVGIIVDKVGAGRPLSKADLKPWRDASEPDPRAGLAAKLYRHSLNRIAALEPSEVALLEAHLAGGQ